MFLKLAIKDLLFDRLISSCQVAAIASIIAPLLLLFSLRNGILTELETKLLQDPKVLSLTLDTSYRLDEQFFARLREQKEVGFVIPEVAALSALVDIKFKSGAQRVSVIPTDLGDPVIIDSGIDFGAPLVHALAATSNLSQSLPTHTEDNSASKSGSSSSAVSGTESTTIGGSGGTAGNVPSGNGTSGSDGSVSDSSIGGVTVSASDGSADSMSGAVTGGNGAGSIAGGAATGAIEQIGAGAVTPSGAASNGATSGGAQSVEGSQSGASATNTTHTGSNSGTSASQSDPVSKISKFGSGLLSAFTKDTPKPLPVSPVILAEDRAVMASDQKAQGTLSSALSDWAVEHLAESSGNMFDFVSDAQQFSAKEGETFIPVDQELEDAIVLDSQQQPASRLNQLPLSGTSAKQEGAANPSAVSGSSSGDSVGDNPSAPVSTDIDSAHSSAASADGVSTKDMISADGQDFIDGSAEGKASSNNKVQAEGIGSSNDNTSVNSKASSENKSQAEGAASSDGNTSADSKASSENKSQAEGIGGSSANTSADSKVGSEDNAQSEDIGSSNGNTSANSKAGSEDKAQAEGIGGSNANTSANSKASSENKGQAEGIGRSNGNTSVEGKPSSENNAQSEGAASLDPNTQSAEQAEGETLAPVKANLEGQDAANSNGAVSGMPSAQAQDTASDLSLSGNKQDSITSKSSVGQADSGSNDSAATQDSVTSLDSANKQEAVVDGKNVDIKEPARANGVTEDSESAGKSEPAHGRVSTEAQNPVDGKTTGEGQATIDGQALVDSKTIVNGKAAMDSKSNVNSQAFAVAQRSHGGNVSTVGSLAVATMESTEASVTAYTKLSTYTNLPVADMALASDSGSTVILSSTLPSAHHNGLTSKSFEHESFTLVPAQILPMPLATTTVQEGLSLIEGLMEVVIPLVNTQALSNLTYVKQSAAQANGAQGNVAQTVAKQDSAISAQYEQNDYAQSALGAAHTSLALAQLNNNALSTQGQTSDIAQAIGDTQAGALGAGAVNGGSSDTNGTQINQETNSQAVVSSQSLSGTLALVDGQTEVGAQDSALNSDTPNLALDNGSSGVGAVNGGSSDTNGAQTNQETNSQAVINGQAMVDGQSLAGTQAMAGSKAGEAEQAMAGDSELDAHNRAASNTGTGSLAAERAAQVAPHESALRNTAFGITDDVSSKTGAGAVTGDSSLNYNWSANFFNHVSSDNSVTTVLSFPFAALEPALDLTMAQMKSLGDKLESNNYVSSYQQPFVTKLNNLTAKQLTSDFPFVFSAAPSNFMAESYQADNSHSMLWSELDWVLKAPQSKPLTASSQTFGLSDYAQANDGANYLGKYLSQDGDMDYISDLNSYPADVFKLLPRTQMAALDSLDSNEAGQELDSNSNAQSTLSSEFGVNSQPIRERDLVPASDITSVQQDEPSSSRDESVTVLEARGQYQEVIQTQTSVQKQAEQNATQNASSKVETTSLDMPAGQESHAEASAEANAVAGAEAIANAESNQAEQSLLKVNPTVDGYREDIDQELSQAHTDAQSTAGDKSNPALDVAHGKIPAEALVSTAAQDNGSNQQQEQAVSVSEQTEDKLTKAEGTAEESTVDGLSGPGHLVDSTKNQEQVVSSEQDVAEQGSAKAESVTANVQTDSKLAPAAQEPAVGAGADNTVSSKQEQQVGIAGTVGTAKVESKPVVAASSAPRGLADDEIFISEDLARQRQVKVGDRLLIIVSRTMNGQRQSARVYFTVRGIVKQRYLNDDAIFTNLKVLTALDDYRNGYEPIIFSDGSNVKTTPRYYAKFRLFATDIDSVIPLYYKLKDQHLSVSSKVGEIENIQAIARVMNFIFIVIALVSGIGGALALSGLMLSSLKSRKKNFVLLRLMGMRARGTYFIVFLENIILSSLGFGLAFGFYYAGSQVFNQYFGSLMPEALISRLDLEHILYFYGATALVAAVLAMWSAKYIFLKAHIADVLREA